MRRVPVVLVGLISFIVACSKGPSPKAASSVAEVRLAAAASLKPVLPGLIREFTSSHPNIAVVATYGASGNFYTQLTSGAPFDLFLSADMGYPQKLADAGLTDGPVREYAQGTLVLWVLKASGLDVSSLSIVTDDRVRKIAIANPQHAPYGRAAEAALKAAGLLESVRTKLVLGESVEQAATFARTGAAEVSILPRSQAMTPAMSEAGVSADIPGALYEPIRHGAIVMKSAKDPAAARAFVDFVLSPPGREILVRAGLAGGK